MSDMLNWAVDFLSTRARKLAVLILAAAFVLFLVLAVRPDPGRKFSKYVSSPVPKTVKVVLFESNDWLAANPEPVCYLAFNASAEDIDKIVRQGTFRPANTNDAVPVPAGPSGWVTAGQVGSGGQVYTRSHSPPGSGGRLPLGRNRRWSEYLWIDRTGTNAYFLLWGV